MYILNKEVTSHLPIITFTLYISSYHIENQILKMSRILFLKGVLL